MTGDEAIDMVQLPSVVSEGLASASAQYDKLTPAGKYAVGITGGLLTLGMINKVITATGGYRIKPSSFELTGGSIAAQNVKAEFDAYSDAYGKDAGVGIKDR